MRKTTNLNDIRVSVAAEVGTFSAASANVELPVSTITRSLTQLENISICCSFVQVSEGQHFPRRQEYLLYCNKSAAALARGRELLDKHRASPSGVPCARRRCVESMK
jgi:hypothetical protein